MTRITSFLKHNAIALCALFIALGGTSYAAVAIPRNSVGARQLRKGAVTAAKLHRGAVSARKLRVGAITPSKLSSKDFGGRILDLAEIGADGSVVVSDPKGITTTMWTTGTGGIVVFPHVIPRGCVPLAGAAAVQSFGPSGSALPSVGVQLQNRNEAQLLFNGQFPVTLEILCGR